MSTINSWCGRICTASFAASVCLVILDYESNALPLNGAYLILYVSTVIVSAVWLTCYLIQKLLQQSQVFEYDFRNSSRVRKLVCRVLQIPFETDSENESIRGSDTPKVTKRFTSLVDSIPLDRFDEKHPRDENIDDRIELLANDIEQRFISKWYRYISCDEAFTTESKLLLESVIRRVLQVSVQVDSGKIACGFLVILLKHLKEYRKAVKRSNKNGSSIEDVYRYCHVANKNESALEHYTHRLTTNVLKEFINWELWNSLPSRLLVAILAKRLTKYAVHYLSQPGFINFKLVSSFASERTFTRLQLETRSYISLSGVNLSKKTEEEEVAECSTPRISPKREVRAFTADVKSSDAIDPTVKDPDSMIEKALTKMIAQQTAPILQRAEMKEGDTSPVAPRKSTAECRTLEGFSPKRSEPVKIHSAKSANKRWDENDVGNVSIGQDLLAMDSSDIQGFSGRRLWGPSLTEHEPDKQSHPLWDINEILKDKDGAESEKDEKLKEKRGKASPPLAHCLKTSTTNAASIITNTIKPIGNVTATTLHNIRDFQQTTVNNVSNATEKAMHKIGDLQDEAVGVVEGIFDFGMAGLRKGLRLTGLQDSLPDAQPKNKHVAAHHPLQHQENIKQSPKNVPKLIKLGHISSEDAKKSSQSVESTDSVWINPIAKESPNGFENQMLFEKSPNVFDNPDACGVDARIVPDIERDPYLNESPEYEETADLASTISKLRSLLQQKSSESSLNTPAASPMPGDERSAVTPNEPQSNDAIKTDGGMQRFARTVTGMFNTFKGALPGNTEQTQMKNDQWIYIENETTETDLASLLNGLLVERRDYCTVDTAYEAMDSLDVLAESVASPTSKIRWENHQTFEDELDDFDSTIPITKALMDVLCECLADTNCALKQEPVVKAFLVVAGRKLENVMNCWADKMLRYINKSIGPLPKSDNDVPLAMELEQMIETVEESLPRAIKNIFGESDVSSGLRFLISSLQSKKMNQDIVLQLFELTCSQLIYASTQMSPAPSA